MLQSEMEFMQAPEYDGDVCDPSLRHISNLLSDDQFREEQGEEDCQQLNQAFSQEVGTTPPAMQSFCVAASEKKPPSIGGKIWTQNDTELTTVQRELRDQRTSITNQGNMINELAKSIDSSNTSVKYLTETVQAFFATFQEQKSYRPDVLVPHPAKTTSSENNSANTREPKSSAKFRNISSKETNNMLPNFKPESSPGPTTNNRAYIASQRRAENPLLPTPNFGRYDNFREEAHPSHYLGRSAGRPTRPSWPAQSSHQSALPAPCERQTQS